jgi:predicted CXXCH cytochrome family protein
MEDDLRRRNRIRPAVLGTFGILFLVLCILGLFVLAPGFADAEEIVPAERSQLANSKGEVVFATLLQDEPTHPPSDQACRLCHADSDSEIIFSSGETLPVAVDLEALSMSAHGTHAGMPLACTDCHAPVDYQFPHEPVAESDIRSFEIARSATCERCHQQPHITSHPGPESDSPVVCTDCHGSHNVLTIDQWQAGEGTETCVDCHMESGVDFVDPVQLSQIIRDGFFAERADNDYCLACHSQPGIVLTFENGDEISVTVDADALHDSVHGVDNPWQPLACTDCHGQLEFPHEEVEATSAREYTLESNSRCQKCHEGKFEQALDSVHGAALEDGNLEAAMCTDCHGAHDTPPPNEPRERISHTCEQCHSTIFNTYAQSVHGEALLVDSNPDVPTCIECHGVHNIADPTTSLARIQSPQLCAQCHADEELMAQYDISTDVFETYVADFHGQTVTLFEDHPDPTVETNKAVCYDCHGVHNIRPVDDPENGIKVNLLETCRQCHPDATANFPDAWTSHFPPSLQNNPLVFLVDTFYAVVIPLTVGALGFLVATDIFRAVRTRFRK